jgi:hypothetical protein
VRLSKYGEELYALKDTHSYSDMADYLLKQYNVLVEPVSIGNMFRRNGWYKPMIHKANPFKHGENREHQDGTVRSCGLSVKRHRQICNSFLRRVR